MDLGGRKRKEQGKACLLACVLTLGYQHLQSNFYLASQLTKSNFPCSLSHIVYAVYYGMRTIQSRASEAIKVH